MGTRARSRGRPSHLLLFMLLVLRVCTGEEEKQVFRVRPEDVEVRLGENVYLCCIVDHQQGRAQWTKDGFALGFERTVPGYPRYQYVGDDTLGEHHLVIRGATLEDDGEYQCQVGPTATNEAIWAGANVTVMVPPMSIVMVGWGDGAVVEVMEGTRLKLECLVIDARPAPAVVWYRDNIRIDPTLHKEVIEPAQMPRMWNVRSQLEMKPGSGDDGRKYSCRALHKALAYAPSSLMASVSLAVFHPPGRPVISEYRTGEVMRAGESRIIVCHVLGGNPSPWVIWYRHGRPLTSNANNRINSNNTVTSAYPARQMRASGGVFVSQQVTASREEDGAVYECRVSSDLLVRPYTTNITLTVHYPPARVNVSGPPAIAVGEEYTLTCVTAPANPPATITWIVQGKSISSATSMVTEDKEGGWVTASRLTRKLTKTKDEKETRVECRADNSASVKGVSRIHVINILERPGIPEVTIETEGQAKAGDKVIVRCTCSGGNPSPDLTLYKGNELLDEVKVESEGSLTTALAAVRVNASDNGEAISCEATNLATSTPIVGQAILNVNFAPWDVSGSVSPQNVEAGQVVKITCKTSSSVPASIVTWHTRAHLLGDPSVKHSPGLYGGTITESKVKVRPEAEDNGLVVVCEAENGLGVTVSTNITLNVLHGPVWLFTPSGMLNVLEGGDLTITAEAMANPGPVTYTWQRGTVTLVGKEEEAGSGQLRLRRVGRHMAGTYTVTASSSRGSVNASFIVDVQYGAENITAPKRVLVDQNDTATVLCSASGNPTPNVTWSRDSDDTSVVLSWGVGEAYLQVEWSTPSDTGIYYCRASNLVSSPPSVATAIVVTQAPTSASSLLEEEEVAGRSWAVVGGNGLLDCRVKASPRPTFEWIAEDGPITDNNRKYDIHVPQLMDSVAEWSSVLEIRSVTAGDFTSYTCVATNPLGSYTLNYTLSPPTHPGTPLSLNVTAVSDTTVEVRWSDFTVGPRPAGYTIRYRTTTGQRHYELVDIPGTNITSLVIEELKPGAEYSFSIQSYNEQGRVYHTSPPVVVIMSEAEDDVVVVEERPKGISFIVFLLIAVTGGVLIVLNIIGVLCFLRRRSYFQEFAASSCKSSAYEVPSPSQVDNLSLSSSDDIPPPDYEQVMGSCRVGSFGGGSLQDLSLPSGSRGTPSLARSSPVVTSSSTISNSGADIIAPPDDFSSGIVNMSPDDHESMSSRYGRGSWANLEADQPICHSASPQQTAYDQEQYRLPRPVGHVSASAFRSMESLAQLYSQHYEPQPAFTLPRRPSQVTYHGQPHLQQQLEQEQAQYQQMEQQKQYQHAQQLSSSVEYEQPAVHEQYFMHQQQCCQQDPVEGSMTVPPPYASLDPSTLYALHTTFEDIHKPSTSYTDWPPMASAYPRSDHGET
ncbi:synaptogenesis protein syg-2-like isoform X2 [Cherax quadricarinatus]